MPLAFSPSLAPGDAIAVVAPSSPFPHDELWRGLAWLRARYRVHLRADALAHDGYLAGSDERRLGELSSALLDDEIKAVVAARGGYGALRLLTKLPWDRIAARPKWIVGFSDITALHAMAWRAGIASVHSPNVTGLGRDSSVALRASWLAALERPSAPRAWENLGVVRGGTASGPLVGGNLTLVHAMAAAGRLAIPEGAVLALEEVSEAPYRIDRMLTSLELGGHFDRVAGLVFGSFTGCDPRADGRSTEDVLEEFGRRLGIPVLIDAPFGHGRGNDSFVLGADVQIRANALVWNPR